MRKLLLSRWTKVAVFLLCSLPIAALIDRTIRGNLGANPVEFFQHATGDWTLRFLIFTLTITPVRKLLNVPELIRFRRMLGLVRVLLRLPALSHLHRPGPIVQFERYVARCREAALHHRRISGICFLDSAGAYIDRRVDSPPGRKALAGSASSHLHISDLWRDPLLLAGEIRRAQTAFLRCAGCGPVVLAFGNLAAKTRATRTRESRNSSHRHTGIIWHRPSSMNCR